MICTNPDQAVNGDKDEWIEWFRMDSVDRMVYGQNGLKTSLILSADSNTYANSFPILVKYISTQNTHLDQRSKKVFCKKFKPKDIEVHCKIKKHSF